MNNPLFVIYFAIGLDAVGIGLVFPILPRLLGEVTGAADLASLVGIVTALYAVMQFIFAPTLGALSDRLGRRPILLVSLAGAAANYAMMAFAPSLALLLVGRAIAGLTSANLSVATAMITDVTPPDDRARRFGLFNAVFGAGFIVGPVLGGFLGDVWVRLPFIAAAGLVALNLALAVVFLPETRPQSHERIDLVALNPLRPLTWAFAMKGLMPVVAIFFVFSATGEVYGTCWALWGYDTFAWNGFWVGLSLGAFGVCQTLAQAFLPGPAARYLGERTAILVGVAGASLALVAMAFADRTWMVFAVMPVFALGGIGVPALQSLATRMVDEGRQGQFQGVLASAVSLSSIIGPLTFSSLYSLIRAIWPGGIWLTVVAVYAVAALLVISLRFQRPETATAS